MALSQGMESELMDLSKIEDLMWLDIGRKMQGFPYTGELYDNVRLSIDYLGDQLIEDFEILNPWREYPSWTRN
jgi:hypothetical protein